MRTIVLLGLFIPQLAACALSGGDAGPARQLYDLADLPALTTGLVESVAIRGNENASALDPGDAARLRQGIAAITDSKAVDASARVGFAAHWQRDEAAAALRWYGSSTGTRMRELERSANQSDPDSALSEFVDEIIRKPVPLRRVALLARLAAAARTAETAAQLETDAERIVLRGVQFIGPSGQALGDESVYARLGAVHASVMGRSRMQSSVIFQYVYREASDDEIEQYVLFAESEAGQWLVERIHDAVAAAADSLEIRFIDALQTEEMSSNP
jgi:hypothetical protein